MTVAAAERDPYDRFLELVPTEGLHSPSTQFLLAVLIEVKGGPADEDLLAAAQQCVSDGYAGPGRPSR